VKGQVWGTPGGEGHRVGDSVFAKLCHLGGPPLPCSANPLLQSGLLRPAEGYCQ
jgi:hypothetical protein